MENDISNFREQTERFLNIALFNYTDADKMVKQLEELEWAVSFMQGPLTYVVKTLNDDLIEELMIYKLLIPIYKRRIEKLRKKK